MEMMSVKRGKEEEWMMENIVTAARLSWKMLSVPEISVISLEI